MIQERQRPRARAYSPAPQRVNGLLHLYHRPLLQRDAATVMEHVSSFRQHSRFHVWNVNTQLGLPSALRGMRFSAVVLHYSIFGAGGYHLDDDFRSFLGEACAESYKVAFFQDECHFCRDRFAFLNEYAIDCVYSCLESEYLDEVYGAHTLVPKLVSNIPGYVSLELREAALRYRLADAQRPVDIGYRGRSLPPYLGRGGREKYEIGLQFLQRARMLDLNLDIACGEGDRIYGGDWYRFIGGCKAILGTESGVSVFDLKDEVYSEYRQLADQGGEVTLAQLERGALGRWEGQIPYRTISPRHFEAAALGTCQILYEGRYSGAMEPMVHYIPLNKDFSNFDEVIERFHDQDLRGELTRNAWRDLIDSGAFSYEAFIAGFDQTLTEAGLEPGISEAEERRVNAALRRGRSTRLLRTHLRDLHDNDFPGKNLLRPFARPVLRGVNRIRSREAH